MSRSAARAEDMSLGFYYSLMDWQHLEGARGLPDRPPDSPASVIGLDCASRPRQSLPRKRLVQIPTAQHHETKGPDAR